MPEQSGPEISFGKGPLQISFKGEPAIREGGWAIRCYLVARAAALLLSPFVAALSIWLAHLHLGWP